MDTERLRDILEAIANIEKYAAQGKEAFTEPTGCGFSRLGEFVCNPFTA